MHLSLPFINFKGSEEAYIPYKNTLIHKMDINSIKIIKMSDTRIRSRIISKNYHSYFECAPVLFPWLHGRSFTRLAAGSAVDFYLSNLNYH